MTVLQHNPFLIASGNPTDPTFPVQRSVRLRSSATATFTRTPASAGNRKTWTWSGWVKRGVLASFHGLMSAGTSNNDWTGFRFNSDDTFAFYRVGPGGGTVFLLNSTQVFRDPSAWYHIVLQWDTTQATASNRIKLYVNGVQVTAFSTSNYPTLNYDDPFMNTAVPHLLGNITGALLWYDGYLTEINFIDGQALKPSSFGGYNPGTGVWEPRKYTGTYGTNGFYLPFSNPASIGADGSGNGNNWTASAGIQTSNSALTTYDSMLDVPTNNSPTNANFCVLNPVSTNVTGIVPLQGNLVLGSSATYNFSLVGTIGVSSGKWYWECRTTDGFTMAGITSLSSLPVQIAPHQSGSQAKIIYSAQANKYDNGTSSAYGATWTSADVIGIALDMDAGTLTFYKNGTSLGVAFTGLTGTYYPIFGGPNSYNIGIINFGQQPFAQTPPTGHNRLNTFNLRDPAITVSKSVFNLYPYTGNGGGLQVGEVQKPASLFNLDRSLRFRRSNSASLTRTVSVAGNRKTWTWAGWVKRGTLGASQTLFDAYSTNENNDTQVYIGASDNLAFSNVISGTQANGFYAITTAAFRDPNMWYHVVFSVDTTQSTAAAALKVYVNGIQQTFSSTTYGGGANQNTWVNSATTHIIGQTSPPNSSYFDGYLADVYFIDGQALTPDSFGQYDGNYYWTPKAYTGTYGTNGFHLEFEDFSGITATTIGKDTSGNGNNWTPSGINLTTPEVDNEYWDSYTDVPTLTSADASNYCVFDPLQFGSNELRNGNLTYVWGTASTAYKYRGTTELTTGKWYFEGNIETFAIGNAGNTNYAFGFITTSGVDTHISFGWTTNGTSMKLGYRYDVAGVIVQNVTYNTVTPVASDIFGIEYDVDNGTANFYKNGTLMGSASGLALGAVKPHAWRTGTSNSATVHINFGQRAFKYTPSTGYKKINSFNIAEVLGDVETPDVVWIKSRSASSDHTLFNSISGVGKYVKPNVAAIETTDVNSLIQFNKNGFLIGNSAAVNTSATTYIAAALKMAATTVVNNGGSITSQVRANPAAGISLVRYTGTGTGALASVGHGLLLPPEVILLKNLSAATSWPVYHVGMGNPLYYMTLNGTAIRLSDNNYWGATLPDASQFYILGTTGAYTNISGNNYEAICMRSIEGFSKFGTYNSNNAADGPFVYTGFRVRWLIVKRAIATTGATGGWFMYDAVRNTYNALDKYLFAESPAGENTLAAFDFTANGFKIRSNNVHVNTTAGDTYTYMAFAENPFKYALAR